MRTIFETERLLIRSFVVEDAEAMFAIQSQPSVMAMTSGQPRMSVEEVRTRLLGNMQNDRPLGRWAAIDKASAALIGRAGLTLAPNASGTPSQDASLGCQFDPRQWGRGLATEVCRGLLDYGFLSVGLERIVGLTHPNNLAIHALSRRFGMTEHGITREYYGGAEMVFTSITCAQWLAIR